MSDYVGSMIDLTDDELLVLFECLHRMCETKLIAISHPSEAVVIDKIASQLERQLSEPFRPSYPQTLSAARDEILHEYRRTMGDHGWVEQLRLDQT